MKILSVGYFDPVRVSAGFRGALRSLGIDYRVAVHRVLDPLEAVDYCSAVGWRPVPTQLGKQDLLLPIYKEELETFAREADVIQFHPGIGGGTAGEWADLTNTWGSDFDGDPPVAEYLGIRWRDLLDRQRLVAYFHGSVSTWANRKRYVEMYREKFTLAASTLDYAYEMGAYYLPPIVPAQHDLAEPRRDDDPLIVVHAPTNPSICSTDEFLRVASQVGAVARLVYRRPHAFAIASKRQSNAGFDHLRGSFSVNTLENCSMGLVPFVAVKPEYNAHLCCSRSCDFEAFPGRANVAGKSLETVLRMFVNDASLTRELQVEARSWFVANFGAKRLAARLKVFYEGL